MRERVGHCVALYRKPAYSPQQHLANDTAIMNAVVAELEQRGWRISRASEAELEAGAPAAAHLYLNMCQGAAASERLTALERSGAVMVNTPTSVLACHRHHLVRALAEAGIPFPRTLIVPTRLTGEAAQTLTAFVSPQRSVWVKRGDVHAVGPEDVVLTRAEQVVAVLGQFADRGIGRVAVQEHVRGPVLKFYGVADSGFFRFYDARWGAAGPAPVVDEARLRAVAGEAAQRLGLKVYGGDVALPEPDQPVLIDLNDWPSFAPFRAEAASAIATFAHAHANPGVAA
jgi:glutathione synthase/RimK-type ligase-like ATP-grasp enzyme